MAAFQFPRKSKYKNTRTDGFPSKLEAQVYYHLVLRERAGEITDIKRQQTVVLQEGDPSVRIAWKVDFSHVEKETGELVYSEAKGMETETYQLKLKLWRKNPPATLHIWKGNYQNPRIVEIIKKPEEVK